MFPEKILHYHGTPVRPLQGGNTDSLVDKQEYFDTGRLITW